MLRLSAINVIVFAVHCPPSCLAESRITFHFCSRFEKISYVTAVDYYVSKLQRGNKPNCKTATKLLQKEVKISA